MSCLIVRTFGGHSNYQMSILPPFCFDVKIPNDLVLKLLCQPEKKNPGLTSVDWVRFLGSAIVGLVAVISSLKVPSADLWVIFAVIPTDANGQYSCVDIRSANEVIGTTTEEIVLNVEQQGNDMPCVAWKICDSLQNLMLLNLELRLTVPGVPLLSPLFYTSVLC
ncbi:hypothetical protein GH714_032552 [Hevea brasiliensis]|uniref:Uncharacterized protein n=1 Tax=Hevea brasiliensis TaxID=3981 RepID=A0A6A6NBG7_HEVBR|nr:hypothetical protein GH714_032552 [Hevea brasiliensis]